MAFESGQIDQITREIAELNALDFDKLTVDQNAGHYERAIELAVLTIGQGNKELSVELLMLGAIFNPKGMDLTKMNEQTDKLEAAPDAPASESDQAQSTMNTPPEGDDGEADSQIIALKRSVDEVKQSNAKMKKASLKVVLKVVLGENNIAFEKDDTNDVMQDRIDAFLAGGVYVPTEPITLKRSFEDIRDELENENGIDTIINLFILRLIMGENNIEYGEYEDAEVLQIRIDAFLEDVEPDVPEQDGKIHTIERANQLSVELQEYCRVIADHQRANGKDGVRFNRFGRDLKRISNQRLK